MKTINPKNKGVQQRCKPNTEEENYTKPIKFKMPKSARKKENLKSSEEIRNMRDKRNKGENYKLFLPNYASIR